MPLDGNDSEHEVVGEELLYNFKIIGDEEP
jgi:hypothetical protein